MKGTDINAAASGLMQGFQFTQGLKRQNRLDDMQEQRLANQAAMDGLTMQQKQAEMADYQANAPLRDQERAVKQQAFDEEANRRDVDTLMMGMEKEYQTTGTLDNSLRTINDRIGDGLDFVGSTVDPKTGAITVKRVDPDTKAEYENTYSSLQDLQSKARVYMGDRKAWSDNWQKRIAEHEKALKQAEEVAKEDRQHKYKMSEIDAQGEKQKEVARLNASSREAVANMRAEWYRTKREEDGNGSVNIRADKRKQTIELMKTLKEDNSFNYATDKDGKPDYKRPRSADEKYNMAYDMLYGDEVDGGSTKPAAGGLTQKPKSSPARDSSMDAFWK